MTQGTLFAPFRRMLHCHSGYPPSSRVHSTRRVYKSIAAIRAQRLRTLVLAHECLLDSTTRILNDCVSKDSWRKSNPTLAISIVEQTHSAHKSNTGIVGMQTSLKRVLIATQITLDEQRICTSIEHIVIFALQPRDKRARIVGISISSVRLDCFIFKPQTAAQVFLRTVVKGSN